MDDLPGTQRAASLQFVSRSLADTERLARALVDVVPPGTLLGLVGDLGAGKTALVRAFVAAVSGDPDAVVTSPTFTLANRYRVGGRRVHHYDVYRVDSFDEVQAAGEREGMFDADAVVFVEWLDRIQADLDAPHLRLDLRVHGERRDITVTAVGAGLGPLVARLAARLDETRGAPAPLERSTPMTFPHKHLVSLADYSTADIQTVLDLAIEVKKNPQKYRTALAGKTLGMVFEKSSTRTRVSFEVGIYQLGGMGLFLSKNDIQIGRGESIPDTARVLSRYLDGIMARTFAHKTITDLAQYASCPIINGLSDLLHPCQALADYQTLLEHKGGLRGLTLTYVGDGNNVLHSLVNGGVKLGVNVHWATPEGYDPNPEIIAEATKVAAATGCHVKAFRDPFEAVAGADAIYTDVWLSMGDDPATKEARFKALAPYQVNEKLMAAAKPDTLFLHCLPAHRGDEVTDAVCDSPNSVIFDEAENRLHAQKAVMLLLMGGV